MDRDRIELFLDRFTGMAAGAAAIGLLAVADRCGLLRWMGEQGGGSSEEIAKGAGLDTRYVTEILSGLAAAGVVDHDNGRFRLPPEHALLVAEETSPYFMGGWLDMLPAGMGHIDRIAEHATTGGGIPFEEFGETMMRGLDRSNAPSQRILLTRKWLPAVPGLVDRLEKGIRVADVGCGTGTVAIEIARAHPNSEITGFDVYLPALATARARAEHLPNIVFVESGVEEIPTEPGFDLITSFDVIHDLVDPAAGLERIRGALREDGMYLMMEPNAASRLEDNLGDQGTLLYGISTLHCMTQSLAAGGMGLGAAWGRERAEEMAAEAGFSSFEPLDDITNRFSAFYLLRP